MLQSTKYWPATDPAIVQLANLITKNTETNDEKVDAIWKWLSPGSNIKYSGHVWCEYFAEGKGWKQVDPTGGNVLPYEMYHLAYFISNDGEMAIVCLKVPIIRVLETKP
jgi:transglutaminase-like putative cysteine protease